jgi:copper transporter 1
MLFTWNTENLCIIFHWWHVSGPISLAFSLLAIVLLTAAYEAIRSGSRRYEAFVNKKQEEVPRKLIPSLSLPYHFDSFLSYFARS